MSHVFLPSDCIDLALAETFHLHWRTHLAKGKNGRDRSVVRAAQDHRIRAYLDDLSECWRRPENTTATPVAALQDYTSTLLALPDHRGIHAKP